MPKVGIEPTFLREERDFESRASASSATSACSTSGLYRYHYRQQSAIAFVDNANSHDGTEKL